MGINTNNNNGNLNSKTSLSEINVTPLVDVMLVLLIIFMVTTPLMQQGLEVNLPEVKSSGVEVNEKPFIIVIKKNGSIFIGTKEQKIPTLAKKLKAIFANRKNKQIYIQADKMVNYGIVAETMGEIKAAGIYNIGLITLPKGEK